MYSIRNYRFALILMAVALSGTPAQPQTECTNGGVLRIRSGPGVDHPIVGTIPIGSVGSVRVGQCAMADDGVSRHRWCRVNYQGVGGWVSACGLP